MTNQDADTVTTWPPVDVLVGEGARATPRPVADVLVETGDFLRSLHRLWTEEAAAAGGVPDRRVLTPDRLRPWLGSISIYQETDDGDFLIKLDGTRIVAWTGEDWTNRRLSEVDAKFGRDLLGTCTRVWQRRCPAFGLPVLLFQSKTKTMHRLLLPVLSADRSARQVMLAMWPAQEPWRQ